MYGEQALRKGDTGFLRNLQQSKLSAGRDFEGRKNWPHMNDTVSGCTLSGHEVQGKKKN